jgi:hypothetical protein
MDGHPGSPPLIGAGAGQNPAYRPAHRQPAEKWPEDQLAFAQNEGQRAMAKARFEGAMAKDPSSSNATYESYNRNLWMHHLNGGAAWR